MYIKRLVIEGFKSYKECTELEFGPYHNVVVGKNGAGKSNVFAAVEFVLSNRYSSLRAEERQSLLHEGSGGRAPLSAFVELTFDNRSKRFPDDHDEITLKRVIGLKKDEYLLNSKHISKTQLDNLLESAGFSRSNPYNIVQQGKVSALLKMHESQRLNLLKEIAGTRVFDQRRSESLKVMKEAQICREQIQEVSDTLEERLNELQEEQDELCSFQRCDRRRRAVEFAVFTKEQRNAEKKITQLDEERRHLHKQSEEVHSRKTALQEQKEALEESLADTMRSLEHKLPSLHSIRDEIADLVKEKSKLELALADAEKAVSRAQSSRTEGESELEHLQSQVLETRSRLQEVTGEFEAKQASEKREMLELERTKQRCNELFAKQARCKRFNDARERDRFLKREIKQRQQTLQEEEGLLASAQSQLGGLHAKLQQLHAQEANAQQDIDKAKEQINYCTERLQTLKKDRDEATNARKELWRQDSQADTSVEELERSRQRAERQLYQTMPRDVRLGLDALNRVVESQRLSGVYGMLLELFDVDPKFEKCVSSTAGTSLFHVVVDTDDTAAKLLTALKRENAGRVTLMPLNRLSAREPSYVASSDAIPMLERLEFEPRFRRAFVQVFGKTVIVRSIALGADYARKHKLTAITLDGDQVSRKGAMTGGFIDTKNSRIKCWRELKRLRGELEAATSQTGGVKAAAQQKDQEVSVILGEMQKCDAARKHHRDHIATLLDEQKKNKHELKVVQAETESKKRAVQCYHESVVSSRVSCETLEKEIGSMFDSSLSREEESELRSLQESVAQRNESLLQLSEARAAVQQHKHELENTLNSNLLVRMEELESGAELLVSEDALLALSETRGELESRTHLLDECKQKESGLEASIEQLQQSIRSLQTQVDTVKQDDNELKQSVASEQRSMERLLNKRSILLEKKDDCIRNIRGLGSLPSHALDKYGEKRVGELMKILKATNEELKQFEHVNKKAIDQFVTFTEQRSVLEERKTELDRGRTAIEKLVQHLDHKKDEAIRRTFASIAHHFTHVFAELVPGGKATLVMQAQKEPSQDDEESDEESPERRQLNKLATDRYSGVAIKVSFSGSGETYLMQQLSGGQQTIVALALIFSIQRCDPFPFYLFDEIDSNLDAAHRTSVAQLIQRQAHQHTDAASSEGDEGAESSSTQFICTTFRPEMLSTADTFLGVVYTNKVSLVRSISREAAGKILEQNEKQVNAPDQDQLSLDERE